MRAGRIKIIVADDEQLICEMLAKLAGEDSQRFEVIGKACDGKTLLEMIELLRPDIVITDICMPVIDGLEVIRSAKQRGIDCRFIIISGYRQFDYAYNAFKYDVADYLLKPINAEELSTVLHKIAEELASADMRKGSDSSALRRYFMRRGLSEPPAGDGSIAGINDTFGTHFADGLYRVMFVKVDYADDVNSIDEDLNSLFKKIESISAEVYTPVCHELLCDTHSDGVMLLLNYTPDRDAEICDLASQLLAQIRTKTDLFNGLFVTLCIGSPRENISLLHGSLDEALGASWTRLLMGLGNVLYWKPDDISEHAAYKLKLNSTDQRIRHAIEILDTEEFSRCAKEFFSLPKAIIIGQDFRCCIRDIIEYFFNTHSDIISEFTDKANLKSEIMHTLSMAYTIEKYESAFKSMFEGLMGEIILHTRTQSARPIRQALAYINENYASHLSLEVLAKEVGFNPVYFSNTFKKETGKTFTDYVTDYRIGIAKEHLRQGDLNISEIAVAVGFPNARYFSKLFKKRVGVTPVEYRRIYG